MNKKSWQESSRCTGKSMKARWKRRLKKEQNRRRRRVAFGEEIAFEKTTGAWELA